VEFPVNDADVVILAGDIARPREAVSWASGFWKPVLYVPGNHEFYGGNIEDSVAELRRLCAGTRIRVLDNDAVVIDAVRFLGTTLWTDFLLFGPGEMRAAAMAEGQRYLRDFSAIELGDGPFTPAASAALFARDCEWLERRLAESFDGPTVVITHHAPARASIHPRFAGSLLNACFVSDLERLMDAKRVPLWVHGHTHDSFDYRVNGTRVVCNPRGYARGAINENSAFDANFRVEIGRDGAETPAD
jgi:predicted phosphodiesterase